MAYSELGGSKMPKSSPKKELAFSVDGHLLRELGEKLVSRPSIALAELVKNAYDADATEVRISFKKVKKKRGTIIVEDNGIGMSIDDVGQTWMRVATSDSRRNPVSPKFSRGRTGEKGIGRFACQLISEQLILESVSETPRGLEMLRAKFVWIDYWNLEHIEDAKVGFEVSSVSEDTDTGTKLTLMHTKQVWGTDEIGMMRRDILSLINPFSWESRMGSTNEKSDPGFSVLFDAPEFPKFKGKLADYYLDAAWCRLRASVRKDGTPAYQLRIRSEGRRRWTPKGIHFPNLGKCEFEIHFFTGRAKEYYGFEFSLRDVQRAGKEHGGVRVYLDKFRVFPYGEAGTDWLKVNRDRARRISDPKGALSKRAKDVERPLLLLPLNRQLVGAVFVSKNDNPNIMFSVTRDRLLENEAYNELVKFVRTGVDWLAVEYVRVLQGKKRRLKSETMEKPKETVQEIKSAITKAIESDDKKVKTESLNVVQNLTMKLEEQLEEEEEELIRLIDMYQILASTGTLVGVLGHEITALVDALDDLHDGLKELEETVSIAQRQAIHDIRSGLRTWSEFVEQLSGAIGIMIRAESRDERKRIAVKEAIDDIAKAYLQYFDMFNIDFKNQVPPDLTTPPMFLAQFYSIIVNLMTNAVKWVMFEKDRRIQFEGIIAKDTIELRVLDSGPGIPEEIREEVFEPFVSYSSPNLERGTGTGLGLTIVQDFVRDHNGEVEFIDPPVGWSTCCKVSFPRL